MLGSRSWFYDDEPEVVGYDLPLNFGSIYKKCHGTILYRHDCGADACGNSACCQSAGAERYIFFLPGELEFHQTLKPGIPFHSVSKQHDDRFHCNGNAGCIYNMRPIDCRSYPFFPKVIEGKHVGYFDLRDGYSCPLRMELELKNHLRQIHSWWPLLLKNKTILQWATKFGSSTTNCPVIEIPDGENR